MDCFDSLNVFIEENESSRGFLRSWIKWWDERRDLLFPAFHEDPNAPKSNLVEVIHSSWESQKQRNLTLHDAAAFDVKESFQLDLEIE